MSGIKTESAVCKDCVPEVLVIPSAKFSYFMIENVHKAQKL